MSFDNIATNNLNLSSSTNNNTLQCNENIIKWNNDLIELGIPMAFILFTPMNVFMEKHFQGKEWPREKLIENIQIPKTPIT